MLTRKFHSALLLTVVIAVISASASANFSHEESEKDRPILAEKTSDLVYKVHATSDVLKTICGKSNARKAAGAVITVSYSVLGIDFNLNTIPDSAGNFCFVLPVFSKVKNVHEQLIPSCECGLGK